MDTLGPRARIGVLVPAFNTVVQPELEALRPAGVTNQVGRFSFDANVVQNVKDEAAKVATAGTSAIVVALSPEGIPGGLALAEGVASEISADLGQPVFAAPHAVLAAMKALGVTRVGLVTPFGAEENGNVREALAEHGVEVVADEALARPLEQISETSVDDLRVAFAAVDREVEALVQVGTGLPTAGLVAELERAHGKPVVACNVASYWQALRGIGIEDRQDGFGVLLKQH